MKHLVLLQSSISGEVIILPPGLKDIKTPHTEQMRNLC